MGKKASLILKILLGVLMLVSVVFFALLMYNLSGDEENITGAAQALIDLNIKWTYALFAFGVGAAILFSIYNIINSGKKAVKSLISVAILIVVCIFSYSIASDEIPHFFGYEQMQQDGILTHSVARTTDTILFITYILFGTAVVSILYSSVSRLWK